MTKEEVEEEEVSRPTGSKKYPVVALGLSLGVPIVSFGLLDGSGQFYNGEVDKGFRFLGLSLGSYGLMIAGVSGWGPVLFGMGDGAVIWIVGVLARVTSYVWASVDAYGSANRINVERGWTTALEPPANSVYLDLAPEGKGRGGMLSFTHRR